MSVVLYLVIAVGLAAFVGGGVWVLREAFKISVGWGLACLLIPFAGLIFLIKHWQLVKLPFLINIVGLIVFSIGMMGLAGYTASAEVKQRARVEWNDSDFDIDSRPDNSEWPSVETTLETPTPQAGEEDFIEVDSETVIPTPTEDAIPTAIVAQTLLQGDNSEARTPTPRSGRRRGWPLVISYDQLPERIGAMIEVHTVDGQNFKVRLLATSENGIMVRQRVGAGSMSFSIRRDTIVEIRAKE